MATTQNKQTQQGAGIASAAAKPVPAKSVPAKGAPVKGAPVKGVVAKVGAGKGVPATAAAKSGDAAAAGWGLRRLTGVRFGLLPVTIFAAVLLLGVRVVDLWSVIATRNGSVPDIQASEARDTAAAALPAATPVGTVTGPNRPPPQPGGRMQVAENAPAKPAPAAAKDGAAKEGAAKEGAAKDAGAKEGAAKEGAAKDGTAGDGNPLSPIDNEQLLKHYADRREELDKKAKDVSMREALLTAAESRIDQKLKELEKVKNQIQGLMKTGDDRQSQQVESLVKIYETMKPKDAARIFEELDMPILLEVIQKMKEAKTAPILAAMDPAKAKAVTSALLERHALPTAVAQ